MFSFSNKHFCFIHRGMHDDEGTQSESEGGPGVNSFIIIVEWC